VLPRDHLNLTLRLTSFPPSMWARHLVDGNKAAYPCSGPAPLQQLKASFPRPVATRLSTDPSCPAYASDTKLSDPFGDQLPAGPMTSRLFVDPVPIRGERGSARRSFSKGEG
jgi:hypothetical protein